MSDYLPKNAKFSLGQIVYHSKFKYRGVIVDADPNFQGTDEWYDSVAKSKPDKNKPWYHVLVHGRELEHGTKVYFYPVWIWQQNHTIHLCPENLDQHPLSLLCI